MTNVAVFASGSGSNFQTLVEAVQTGRIEANLSLLVCDRPYAKVIDRAKQANVPTFIFSPKNYDGKAHFEKKIALELKKHGVEWLVLAGYMRLIGTTLLSKFEDRIINIHPSLLPSFPGKDAIGQALATGVKVSGVTIHYVDKGMDTGKIIAQQAVPVLEDDDHKSLQKRIQQAEHELYPKTIAKLVRGV